MALWIEKKYVSYLSPKLQQFKQKDVNLWSFRCCFCGDSSSNKFKTRGFIYLKGQNYYFRCHNCNYGTNLYGLINHLDPALAKEFTLELFLERRGKSPEQSIVMPKKPKFKNSPKLELPTIASLANNHKAKKYLLDRKLPDASLHFLYFAKDFGEFASTVSDKHLDTSDSRIVIPFFSKSGELIAFQGRSLSITNIMRYITIKCVDTDKIFGLDRIDSNQRMHVVEGPIDSLFIPNTLATADSNLSSVAKLFPKDNLVLVPDNEPRNFSIVKNIDRYIKDGFSVCLFPDYIKGKDINEMILNGLTKDEIYDIIKSNTYKDLRASIEFKKWRKV